MITNCENCQVEFFKKPAEIKRTKHNLCSKKCTGEFKQEKTAQIFWDKAKKNNRCLEWTHARNKYGYGIQRFRRKIMLAHRVSYILSKGEIPEGMFVLHSCDNPRCISPDHLFLGTHQDNMDDMIIKERKTTKLSFNDVSKIRASDLKNSELAIIYGVSERGIRYAKDTRNWKLPSPPSTGEK